MSWSGFTALLLLAGLPGAALAQAGLYPASGLSPLAVKQGVLGSCYFHASIAALAQASPDTLRRAISLNPMGGYKVHFASGPDEMVFQDDIQYGRAHNYDRSDGDWVLVLMRAYAQRTVRHSLSNSIQSSALIPVYLKPMALQWLNEYGLLVVAYDRTIRTVVSQDGDIDKATLKRTLAAQMTALGIPSTQAFALTGFLDDKGFFDALAMTVRQNGEVFGAYKAVGQGGIPVRVMEALKGTAQASQVASQQQFINQLRRLHQGGMAMVAGTFSAPRGDTGGVNWWVGQHAYSLLDFDESSQTVSVRNPWGTRPDPNGNFTLPLSSVLQNFEDYSYTE